MDFVEVDVCVCAHLSPPGNRMGVLQAPSSPLVLEWVTLSLFL